MVQGRAVRKASKSHGSGRVSRCSKYDVGSGRVTRSSKYHGSLQQLKNSRVGFGHDPRGMWAMSPIGPP